MNNEIICDWCEEGVCTYGRDLEQQYNDEQDGLPADYCNGTEEEQKECGAYENQQKRGGREYD